jgi:hypothetical protein
MTACPTQDEPRMNRSCSEHTLYPSLPAFTLPVPLRAANERKCPCQTSSSPFDEGFLTHLVQRTRPPANDPPFAMGSPLYQFAMIRRSVHPTGPMHILRRSFAYPRNIPGWAVHSFPCLVSTIGRIIPCKVSHLAIRTVKTPPSVRESFCFSFYDEEKSTATIQ